MKTQITSAIFALFILLSISHSRLSAQAFSPLFPVERYTDIGPGQYWWEVGELTTTGVFTTNFGPFLSDYSSSTANGGVIRSQILAISGQVVIESGTWDFYNIVWSGQFPFPRLSTTVYRVGIHGLYILRSSNSNLPSAAPVVRAPPSVTTAPRSATTFTGGSVTFSVTANGTAPLSYQWLKNGAAIAGATDTSLTVVNANALSAGGYSVRISNSVGSVTSNAATLTVTTISPGTNSRLGNISLRTPMAAGQVLIVGMVVEGGNRNVLVRAAGPALTAFGITNAMSDPRLELFDGTAKVFENENWPGTLTDTFSSVGAFGFQPGSRDAAMLQSISGARSIQVRGTGPGLVLVEAYDVGSGNGPRLVNVSARNRVGTGDDVLIAGFNVIGTGAKQLLIRAVGPTLRRFGVTGSLNDPKIEIYGTGGTKLVENDNWAAAISPTFATVGAFALDAASRDAALVTVLSPGSYTVQVRGADGGTGEALVEIYEVP